MGQTSTLQDGFRRFITDAPREALPKGAVYRMTDWIPQGPESRKRGGWDSFYAGYNALSAATYMSGVGWAPYASGGKLLAVSDAGKAYLNAAYIGATHGQALTHRPFWHRDRMIVCGNLFGAAVNPYKVYDTGGASFTTAVVGGTPPKARGGCSWGDYLMLLNYYDPSDAGNLKNYRVEWSAVGDPDTHVYSGANASTLDLPAEVLTAMRLRNITLFFGYENIWIYTGDTPPPGGNLARSRTLALGTFDSRSVAQYKDQAIFANSSGVWMTDGSSEVELTKQGGISTYYRSLFESFTASDSYAVAGEVIFNYYVLTFTAGGDEVATIVCDLEDYSWFGLSNFPALMYARRAAGASLNEELFFASSEAAQIGALSTAFQLSNVDNMQDGNGADVEPSFETGFFLLSNNKAEKRVRRAYFNYFLGVTEGDDQTMTVSYTLSPYNSVYTTITPDLAVNSELSRVALDVREKTNGIAFKVVQSGGNVYDSVVTTIEAEGHAMEESR